MSVRLDYSKEAGRREYLHTSVYTQRRLTAGTSVFSALTKQNNVIVVQLRFREAVITAAIIHTVSECRASRVPGDHAVAWSGVYVDHYSQNPRSSVRRTKPMPHYFNQTFIGVSYNAS